MPYLHWETDRQRERFAAKIENITENWKNKKYEDWRARKEKRQHDRKGLRKPPKFEAPEEKEGKSSRCKGKKHFGEVFSNSLRVESHGGVSKPNFSFLPNPTIKTNGH
jgi:hypothetical protein